MGFAWQSRAWDTQLELLGRQDPARRVLHHLAPRGHQHGAGLVHLGLHPRSAAGHRRHEPFHAARGHHRREEQLAGQCHRRPRHALRLVRDGDADQRAAEDGRQPLAAGSEAVRRRACAERRHCRGRAQHRVRAPVGCSTEGLPIVAEDVGGTTPRRVIYFPSDGKVRVRHLRTGRGPGSRHPRAPVHGYGGAGRRCVDDIELFED